MGHGVHVNGVRHDSIHDAVGEGRHDVPSHAGTKKRPPLWRLANKVESKFDLDQESFRGNKAPPGVPVAALNQILLGVGMNPKPSSGHASSRPRETFGLSPKE